MDYSRIVCIPDLLRGVRGFPEVFFDLVREPIHQGTGIDIGHPPGGKRPHGLASGFDLAEFRALAGMAVDTFADSNARQMQWSATYHHVPERAIDYLFSHPPGKLVKPHFH